MSAFEYPSLKTVSTSVKKRILSYQRVKNISIYSKINAYIICH